MPRYFQLRIGNVLGLSLRLLAWKRKLIRSNLLLAFPGAGLDAISYRRSIEIGFYRHFGNLVIELLCQFGHWRKWVLRNVEISGLEHWERAASAGKGVMFITSHLGNWEAMSAGFSVFGRDLLIVTKHLKPEWVHQLFEMSRLKAGVRGTYEPKTMKDVLRQLSRGGTVGFVLDQYAGAPIGVRVPFFGIPVGTLQAPASIVRRTGAVALPATCYREGDGRLRVRVGAEIPWETHENPHEELARNVAKWVAGIESTIRSHPEQWLWSHRRFKGDLSPLAPDEWGHPRERR
ncbi:MAG: lysophospholipid acyltransferase family protein [Bdellovibrionales bacterium]|nr:lysophospholipid acyltransferase family protein [Bdellovibrionales bacterium]